MYVFYKKNDNVDNVHNIHSKRNLRDKIQHNINILCSELILSLEFYIKHIFATTFMPVDLINTCQEESLF